MIVDCGLWIVCWGLKEWMIWDWVTRDQLLMIGVAIG